LGCAVLLARLERIVGHSKHRLRAAARRAEGADARKSLKPRLSAMFVKYLLQRNFQYRDDLLDQLFNSSEKRLAPVLLLMAQFGKEGVPELLVPGLTQETRGEMLRTTRSRVSFFISRFRKLGFINYDIEDNLQSFLAWGILYP
jgi:CRP/FNR family cyclic AMP-dependent transcriptional regulator